MTRRAVGASFEFAFFVVVAPWAVTTNAVSLGTKTLQYHDFFTSIRHNWHSPLHPQHSRKNPPPTLAGFCLFYQERNQAVAVTRLHHPSKRFSNFMLVSIHHSVRFAYSCTIFSLIGNGDSSYCCNEHQQYKSVPKQIFVLPIVLAYPCAKSPFVS